MEARTGINLDTYTDLLSGGFGQHDYENTMKVKWTNMLESQQNTPFKFYQSIIKILGDAENVIFEKLITEIEKFTANITIMHEDILDHIEGPESRDDKFYYKKSKKNLKNASLLIVGAIILINIAQRLSFLAAITPIITQALLHDAAILDSKVTHYF